MIVALAVALATAAAPDAGQRLADLQRIYAQSCDVRAYGSFDDLCDQLKKQMREAEKAHRVALRDRARADRVKPPVPVPANHQDAD